MPGTRALALLSALAAAPLPTPAWGQAVPMQADRDCPGPGCPPATAAQVTTTATGRATTRSRTAGEILALFSGAAERAVCIGTTEQCARQGDAADAASVDLLVTFEFDSAQLTRDARYALRPVAEALNDEALRDARFEIAGHTDARGDAGYNRALSQSRAQAVARLLAEMGVPSDRLDAVGYGESRPLSADPYAPVNRRVEIALIGRPPARPATAIAGDPDPWDGRQGAGGGAAGGSAGGSAGSW